MDTVPEYSRRSFGAIGAERLVVVIRPGLHATTDPDPAVTSTHRARVVVLALDADALDDPAAFGGETPAEESVKVLANLIAVETHTRLGIVGVGTAGSLTLKIVERLGESVDRLALVGVPRPRHPLTGDLLAHTLPTIAATTLILDGEHDAQASHADAVWYRDRLPKSEIEIFAGDRPFGLGEVWARVLSHCAPGTARP